MSFKITFPDNTTSIIDGIRDTIGVSVLFMHETKTVYSGSDIDPNTAEALDPFASTADGSGYVTVYSGVPLLAHVTWKPSDFSHLYPAGEYFEGDCQAQIKLIGDIVSGETVTLLDNTDHVVIDGHKMDIKRRDFRGVPDRNRIILTLVERGKDG